MRYRCGLFIVLILGCLSTEAQQKDSTNRTLYTAGHAGAFIGGLYDGFYPYSQLMWHGDFGLGAPDKLDGELLMLNGRIYQTQSTGKTTELKKGVTPFAVVNFFHADQSFRIPAGLTKERLFAWLDSIFPKQNYIYAIHIRGAFKRIKTRAFPPVTQKPYQPLASMIGLQHFFNLDQISGDLVGYRIPEFMEGANISGYHFHFLSADKQHGGHLIDLETSDVTVEVERLDSFNVYIPQTKDFEQFDFRKDRTEEIKAVENGKRN